MKGILKNILYFFCGLFSFGKKNKAMALMYHSISDSDVFFAVKKEDFLQQIKYLVEKKYNVVSIEMLYNYIIDKNIPAKTITITFDDGYRDNFLNAYSILKKYNIPATIFVSTLLIGTSIKARNGETFDIINYEDILEMQKDGLIKFESHCRNHSKLVKLDEKEVDDELLLSKKDIEEKIEEDSNFLAYPFGSFNKEVKNVAKKYYKMAFTVEKGIINSSSDLFELKRNSIDSEVNFLQFKNIIKNGRI